MWILELASFIVGHVGRNGPNTAAPAQIQKFEMVTGKKTRKKRNPMRTRPHKHSADEPSNGFTLN